MPPAVEQRNPATGELVGRAEVTSLGDVTNALHAARAAQVDWSTKTFAERSKHIIKIKQYFINNAEKCAETVAKCTGKTKQDAMATEVLPSIIGVGWYADNAVEALRKTYVGPRGSILFYNKSSVSEYIPIGVVAVIAPWNYPLGIPIPEIVMGLMAGNAVVLKSAPATVLVGTLIEDIIKSAELPEGLFTHVNIHDSEIEGFQDALFKTMPKSAPTTKQTLTMGSKLPIVGKVFFTGSTRVGRKLMCAAADPLTPLSLELGGKDPMVVLEDADIERAVNCACWAGYQNAGQSCAGVERIYVHKNIYGEFVRKLSQKTAALRHGSDTLTPGAVDLGSLTTKAQLEIVKKQVNDAVKAGAKIEAQSKAIGDVSKGLFHPATILTGVDHTMDVMTEETFGPVLGVMPFESETEAIDLANDSNLALTASVFSKSAERGSFVASRLEAGTVTVNDHLYTHGMTEDPWGGWKLSGLGAGSKTHGAAGLKAMCHVRTVNTDFLPSKWSPSNIWWYPQTKDSYKGIEAARNLAAPSEDASIQDRLFNMVGLTRFAVSKMFKPWRVDDATKGKAE